MSVTDISSGRLTYVIKKGRREGEGDLRRCLGSVMQFAHEQVYAFLIEKKELNRLRRVKSQVKNIPARVRE